ncbi:hypothetical protein E5720_17660 [Rhodococcus sp. PAMC28707]|uniref:hypothetical protein n=1 Tax=unclassified Rhodococcus (in: high G+C Gram-positive bacteria) TaxID=192944 RepID=UPI00109E061D|nr:MULTISPECIES: hypothetical protein [unclassified Rhodococcus (in: high G+C Gram-positive bacteria)]QCB51791.1 hypothetical protein E5769_17865 [Rhodococcus sp. PAMC28705]QCB60041.1 hypothetical protein E5720_17660 [Rhodococcus sp. PAMC28707]
MTVTTFDRAGLTLLVMPAERPADLLQAYPIDLGETTDEIAEALLAVSFLEEITPDQFIVTGIEFADPEQHNTTITLNSADLDETTWMLGDGPGR